VHPVDPVLAALHEQGGLFQIQLVELNAAQLRHAQSVAVKHQHHQLIANGIPALLCGLAQGLNLRGRDPVLIFSI
jgi:hypothetical protein